VDNPHNIALCLFNRDPISPIQSIVFGALHCDSGLLFARKHVGGHTTKNPGLYAPGGALLEEHFVGVTSFSLLDLCARPEPLLPRGFQAAPRDQWAVSFVVMTEDGATAAATARHHNALTLRERFALPFAAISQGKYLEADYTLPSLLYLGGADDAAAPAPAAASSPSKHKDKRPRAEEEEAPR
jgi:hypothetical protein